MYTIVTLRAAPAFARGQVRDLRPRWALEEAGLPYTTRTVSFAELKAPPFAALQPFHQVPVLEEAGRPPVFESGAMLIAIAERAGLLLPTDGALRTGTLSWLFAAANSIEPYLMNVAEADFFLPDETARSVRRPVVMEAAHRQLAALERVVPDEGWLAGDFSIADIMMATVLRIGDHADLWQACPGITAYKARCESRPAFRRALNGQLHDVAELALPA